MHKIGDLIHSQFKAWEDQVGKGNERAAMGDAKGWDHSLYPELMALEAEFVCSFYEEKHCNPGHRMTGHIFTWMNSFLNAVIHRWAWLKVLGLPNDADLEKWVTMRVDGDENYHIGPVTVVNEENLKKLAFYMKMWLYSN